ncbi:MAG: HlyD family efflux transporter periplasmic adaptor subunit [Gammaproteobacteria bacterium]|jgi:RND family efflux transporter MFP subunit|nr:HlyD family efflux transporter periplasmic adaptor subunit [Gammaproteobacteria bacterium]MBT4082089.1 HlyD family efflux transporter periplasmic adaptor subunit [Gammaproteobacteria bacterium]MBT5371990.1 HlyD family efflux transporter periplasmic adaptor subunit [Gammaproteobacteria bacterium]MBT5635972.1 HlyD family efflux transporter periplasmic adaptor subunit [Gammaproteobacteria bacterium]MBT5687920.1 HlyD family efflux transporter periplasmic adaptor subunit [Gammaproteobacteria bact
MRPLLIYSVLLFTAMACRAEAKEIETPVLSEVYQARAVLEPLHQATLSAEISAQVTALPLRNGELFQQKDLLVAFDCEIFERNREKININRRAAAAKLENDRRLEAADSIGKLEVVLSETALEQAEVELQIAEINTSRCKITAPWSGVVVERFVNEYESVELNQGLLRIVSSDAHELAIVVPSGWLRWLKPGHTIEVVIDETGSRHQGSVIAIGGEVDSASQTVTLRGQLQGSQKNLLSGMSATVHFSTQ